MSETPAVYTTNPEPQSSVELSISAKGVVQPVVKVYAASAEEASAQAQRLFDALLEKYGRPQP